MTKQKSKSLISSAKIALATMLFMTLYESMKQLIIPDISTWQSHTVTIIFSTILAAGAGYFFLNKEEKLLRKLDRALVFHQQLLDKIPVPIFYKNEEYIYTGCNKSFEDLLGMDRQEIIGKSVYELAPKNLADIYHKKDWELINTPGIQVYEFDVKDPKTGTKRQVIFHKAILEKPDGQIGGLVGAILDITERKNIATEKEQLIEKLQLALSEIQTLRGIIPICAACKKIRSDSGLWSKVEEYIEAHSEAEFTHSVCPDCAQNLYPELIDDSGNIKRKKQSPLEL